MDALPGRSWVLLLLSIAVAPLRMGGFVSLPGLPSLCLAMALLRISFPSGAALHPCALHVHRIQIYLFFPAPPTMPPSPSVRDIEGQGDRQTEATKRHRHRRRIRCGLSNKLNLADPFENIYTNLPMSVCFVVVVPGPFLIS